MYFSILEGNTYFFQLYNTVIQVLCVLLKNRHKFYLKFREIFPWREAALSAQGRKSYEKPFFCQNYAICTCCYWKVFFFIFKLIWRYFLSLIVPLITNFFFNNQQIINSISKLYMAFVHYELAKTVLSLYNFKGSKLGTFCTQALVHYEFAIIKT